MTLVNDERYDAVVIGARCAGAATSMLLARAGLAVLNVDRSQAGTDTLSTHALMRGGVLQFKRWGLLEALERLNAPAIDRTSFYYGDEAIEVSIKPKHGVSVLYAPRRRELDALLVAAAKRAGARVQHNTSLVGLLRAADGRVVGVKLRGHDGALRHVRSSVVIGADGVGSKLAKLVGAPYLLTTEHTSSTIYRYFTGLELDGYHWHYSKALAAGAIPTSGGACCVFVGLPPEAFHHRARLELGLLFERSLERSAPSLFQRVKEAEPIERYRAFGGHAGFIRQSFGPGWALVGDASYFKDPGTAHGMTDALRDAELLARNVVQHPADLRGYQEERDGLARPFLDLTDRIVSFDWSYDELKHYHRELSREMNREADYMAGLTSPTATERRAPAAAYL